MDAPTSPPQPPTSDPQRITALLGAVSAGDPRAVEQLIPLVYDHLRALAGQCLRRRSDQPTLQATELVHEVFLRLVDRTNGSWNDRAHFLALAATAMRHILADHARARRAEKRGGGRQRVTLTVAAPASWGEIDLIELDDLLRRLGELNPRHARIVEMRFLAGMTAEEVGQVLGVSRTTVDNEWRVIKAWLRSQLQRAPGT